MKIQIPLITILFLTLILCLAPAAKPADSYASNSLWDDLSSTIRSKANLSHTLASKQNLSVMA